MPNITRLVLVNADAHTDLFVLASANEIFPATAIAIRADTDVPADSVEFHLDGVLVHTEHFAPYCINGDDGECLPWTPPPIGPHSLRVVATFGAQSVEKTVSFTITASAPPPPPPPVNEVEETTPEIRLVAATGGNVNLQELIKITNTDTGATREEWRNAVIDSTGDPVILHAVIETSLRIPNGLLLAAK